MPALPHSAARSGRTLGAGVGQASREETADRSGESGSGQYGDLNGGSALNLANKPLSLAMT